MIEMSSTYLIIPYYLLLLLILKYHDVFTIFRGLRRNSAEEGDSWASNNERVSYLEARFLAKTCWVDLTWTNHNVE